MLAALSCNSIMVYDRILRSLLHTPLKQTGTMMVCVSGVPLKIIKENSQSCVLINFVQTQVFAIFLFL